ncbi:MAG TPA: plastocyanin/azurin family copper-binding protein [Thermoleophilaceae bacterium]|jgi:plastocyanin
MRRGLLTAAAAALAGSLAVALGAGGASAGSAQLHAAASTKTVKVGDDFFDPTKVTIRQKDVVKWVWVGADGKPGETANEHTVTEIHDKFTSKLLTKGSYSRRFKTAGTFKILCAEHPDTMRMKVVVKKRS